MIIDEPKRAHIPALKTLWQEAFDDGEEFFDIFEQTAFAIERCRCVTIDDTVVAALYWFDCSCCDRRIAYLYAIATAKSHRGRGICRLLMEDTHRYLTALGYEGVVLVPASEDLFLFYQKIGYQVCGYIREFCCYALADEVELRQINANEYAALRRRFLPKGGVIQENENLDFFQAQVTFYAGKGFLLAARRETDTLYGVELLGDTTPAPAIVWALGCTEGKFRTPGGDKPFAMFYPLGEQKLLPPAYFGLAFD